MTDTQGYAVFLFPQALEALGDAVKPYLVDGPGGPRVLCQEIDTAGALIEMTLAGRTAEGQLVELELMIPTSMVRMIVSARSDGSFGFGPHVAPSPVVHLSPMEAAATPSGEPSQVAPPSEATPDTTPTQTSQKL